LEGEEEEEEAAEARWDCLGWAAGTAAHLSQGYLRYSALCFA